MKIELPKYFTMSEFAQGGIYFILKNGKIIYVGQTKNIISRLMAHPVLSKVKKCQIRFIPLANQDLRKHYERRWILRFRPKYNTIHLFIYKGSTLWGKRRKKVEIDESYIPEYIKKALATKEKRDKKFELLKEKYA